MSAGPDLSLLSHEQKDALIHTLVAQVAALTARVAELEAKLGLPPKTPDNSSVPPSKGQKASEPSKPRPKANPHAGAHRPLHPNPTRERIVSASNTYPPCGGKQTIVLLIEIRSMSGGDWKPLISLDPTQMVFTADGSWLLYHDSDVAGKQSLFRVATAGGQPQRIGDFPGASKEGRLNISPDRKKIVAEAPIGTEVWLLENFEPKKPPAR